MIPIAGPALRLVLAAILAVAPAPAIAGQSGRGIDAPGAALLLPPPAETGKPAIVPPYVASPAETNGCVPALPCGTRLLGTIRKDGAVELQVPALRW
ncbi:MAG TPA: hypothetical protein VJR70_00650 [Stellaceae bacterium]|nr:hypothetical protein [Stellaceae bacterium]